ncbi:hypothetical protein ASD89_10665 [Caulobacter sp. Root656]|nr:hypothetical protein ASD89_10665 [Caulobacter sp. Root656]
MRTALTAVSLMAVAGVAIAAAPLSTATTPIGEILDNPAAKAVVDRHLPSVFANPQIRMARPLTLKGLQRFAKDTVSDSALAAIDKDFAALSAKK